MLDQDIKRYLELKSKIDDQKKELDDLKESILEEMGSREEFVTEDGIKAKITFKDKYDYVDEVAIINWLKANGYGCYVSEVVDSKKLNKELKKGTTLTESLKTLYKKTEIKALSVATTNE